MVSRVGILAVAALVACKRPGKAEQIPLDQIKVSDNAHLRTSPVGGKMSAEEIRARDKLGDTTYDVGEGVPIEASYVLVDAENRSDRDANVTLTGTLGGADQTAPLRAESLFIPAGGTRTFLMLDDGLAPRPWATGVKVIVRGAVVAKFLPPMAVSDVHVFTDGDHVVSAAMVTNTAKRQGKGIVLAAFHDAGGVPIARGHSVLILDAGQSQSVRFVGPPGSKTGTIFAGESTF